MADIKRVTPEDVRPRMREPEGPLLVCAYEDEDKCRGMRLDGALTLREFQDRLPTIRKDREIAFYCA
jgi:hypothetical protein